MRLSIKNDNRYPLSMTIAFCMALFKFTSENSETNKRVDSKLLADVLGGLDIFLDKHNKKLPSKDKAQLAATLYEQLSNKKPPQKAGNEPR